MLQALRLLMLPLACLAVRPEVDDDVVDSHQLGQAGAVNSACDSCRGNIHIEASMGLEWVVFPPSPFPNPIWTYTCMPEPTTDWDVGLDLPLCPPEAEKAGGVVKEKCQSFKDLKQETVGQYLHRKMSGVVAYPVGFFNQMLACVGCTFCQIGDMIQAQWDRFAAITRRMLVRLNSARHKALGYSHDGPTGMARDHAAIRRMMKGGLGSSLLEAGPGAAHVAWNSTDAAIEESLRLALEQHSPDPAAQRERLSLIQASMDEFGSSGGLHRLLLEAQLNQTDSLWRRKLRQAQPALQTETCQEAFYRKQDDWTVDFSLNVEFPDLGEALLNAVLGNPVGVIMALIPEVLLMAIPRSNLQFRQEPVNACLKLVESEYHDESCFDERPFLACTTRAMQKVLVMALHGRWWPMGDGLDARFSDIRHLLRSATARTCLEYDQAAQTKHKPDEAWLDEQLEMQDGISEELFNHRQCPVIKTGVDDALQDDSGLPTNDAYAIWVAAVLSQGPQATKECPDFTPFVTGFCAEQLHCTENTGLAKGAPFPGKIQGEQFASSDAVGFVSGLHKQNTPAKEQWGELWRAVKWVGDRTEVKLGWRDMRGMFKDGSATAGLKEAAAFWSAVHGHALKSDALRETVTPQRFARMADTWKGLVVEYRGSFKWGAHASSMCAALRMPDDEAARKKVADGEEGYAVLGAGLACCCWGKKSCTQEQLDEENAKGKGRVFNLVTGNASKGDTSKICCRLQKERLGCGMLGLPGIFGGRFAEAAVDIGACVRTAWG